MFVDNFLFDSICYQFFKWKNVNEISLISFYISKLFLLGIYLVSQFPIQRSVRVHAMLSKALDLSNRIIDIKNNI